jgi:YVTN family beta-propeller protein
VTPDGATAIVAVGGGFFGGVAGSVIGSPEVPEGSALLSVDLASGVATPIALRHAPMGVVVTPDGARAFVAEYGGSELAVVDLASNAVVTEVPLAGGPEQVSLDATGARGIVGTDEDGSFRTFDPADPAGTMSAPLRTSADPNGAAFVAGTTLAVVASSIVPSGWAVLETADGAAPVSKSTGSLTQGPPYAVAAIPGTTSVLVGEAGKPARLVRVDAAAEPAAASEPIVLPNAASAFPLGVAVDPAGRFAFVPLTGDGSLAVVDLAAGTARRVAWPSGVGPSWATVVRSPGAPSAPPPGG